MLWRPPVVSAWCPVTFTADSVRQLSAVACPKLNLAVDAADLAFDMNDAAHDLLLGVLGITTAAGEQKWATGIAADAQHLIAAVGTPSARTASRLGLDFEQFSGMMEAVRRLASAASRHAQRAGETKKQRSPARPPAEDAWLRRMRAIYCMAFGRPSGITRANDQRGGPCGRFIAAAAQQLASDDRIDAGESWREALARMDSAKKVAGQLERLG